FQHMGRYLLPIVPLLAVAAAYVFVVASGRHWVLPVLATIVVGATGLYALAFHIIYTNTTTRLVANDWIAKHVAAGSRIASENWDDSLPVGAEAAARYQLVIVPVFDPDDGTKLRKLYDGVETSDYYALS